MKPKRMAAGLVSVCAGRDTVYPTRDEVELKRIERTGRGSRSFARRGRQTLRRPEQLPHRHKRHGRRAEFSDGAALTETRLKRGRTPELWFGQKDFRHVFNFAIQTSSYLRVNIRTLTYFRAAEAKQEFSTCNLPRDAGNRPRNNR